MTSVNLQQWIQHPETLNRDTLYELRNQLARYPYFQSLRLLYLKNLYILHDINFGAELRKAVLDEYEKLLAENDLSNKMLAGHMKGSILPLLRFTAFCPRADIQKRSAAPDPFLGA